MGDQNLDVILQGCRRKDRSAQKQLYRLFYAYAMSVSLRYSGGQDEAIDIANDAFLKVFLHIDQYDHTRPFKPWFRQILVYTAINYVKKKHGVKMQELKQSELDLPDTDRILARIGFEELLRMVSSLSTAYRTVFNMFVIDGFSHEEIAERLGITTGTSKSNLSKARENLRRMVLKEINS
jgi:RNA polymerase sigma factor (sigma-70 family)